MSNADTLSVYLAITKEKPQLNDARLINVRADHFILELNALKELVALNEQKLRTAEYQIKILTLTNRRFKQKLNRLTRMCLQVSQFSSSRRS